MRPFSRLCLLLLLTLIWMSAAAHAQSGARPRATALFRSLHLLGANGSVTRVSVGAPTAFGSGAATSSQARTAAGVSSFSNALTSGDVQFVFQGYSAAQKSILQNYINANYARMTAIFGQPAPEQRGKVVTVQSTSGNEVNYIPPAATNPGGGLIQFDYDDRAGVSTAINLYNFTRVVLLAFQGPRVPAFNFAVGNYVEPWLFGMSDAAALLVAFQVAGSPANFDAAALTNYVLPVYDFLNRPELGNAYIYPRDGSDIVISDFRSAMAQSAFLKIAIENPAFFAGFNAKLYARGAARAPITPAELQALAASVVPSVEGQDFNDWVRRQYALDATVTSGPKLYLGLVPTLSGSNADVLGSALAFKTNADGSETALTGYGSLAAFDETGRDISAFSSELRGDNVLSFNDPSAPGAANVRAAFAPFGSPERALITVKARLGETEATSYVPYRVAGTLTSAPSYFGGTLGAQSGTLQISGSANQSVVVARGAWAATARYPSGPRVQTQFALGGATLRRNTAWLTPGDGALVRSVGFLLEAPSNLQTFNFAAPAGASHLRMISLPFTPLQTDEARALNKTSAALALARYRPRLSEPTAQNGALVFGIGGDRYEIYPDISAPFAPGRGYWLGVETSGYATQIQGSEPPRDKPYEVPLEGGWNQVGVPFNRAFSVSAIRVRYGGFAPVSLSVAQARGYVAPGVWRWLPQGGYARADVSNGQLAPFEGVFIFAGAQRGVSLVFDANATAAAASALTVAGGWSVPLRASSGQFSDNAGRFGVSNLPNIAKPPAAERMITLHFEGSDAQGASAAGGGLAEAYAPDMEGARWTAIVEGADKGARVTLDWGDLRGVPADATLTLTDAATGHSIVMTRGKSYAFTSDGTPRRLEIAPTAGSPQIAPELTPSAPTTKTILSVNPHGTDGLNYRYRWTNGGRVLAGENGATLDLGVAGNGDHGDHITVEVTATNAAGASAVATASVVVANSAPLVANGTLRAQTGQTASVALSSADDDGDDLVIRRASGPFHGNGDVRLVNGVWTLFYTGYKGYSGPDSVEVVAFDGHGGRSKTATIRVTVWPAMPANGAPSAFDVNVDTAFGESATAVLRGFDPNGDALTFRLVRGTRYGSSDVRLDPADGQWKLWTRNIVRPPDGEDRAQFVAIDTQGRTSAFATVTLHFHNRPPVAEDADLSATSGVEVALVLRGSDPDRDALTFRRVGGPREGVGDVRRDSDGVWKLFYRSRAGWTGHDEVRFVAFDEQGRSSAPATVSIEVVAASSAPISAASVDSSGGHS